MKLTERDITFIKEQIKEVVRVIEKLTDEVKILNIARRK